MDIKAKFVKPEPTQEGITLTLKIAVTDKKEKQAILAACAYLYDEEVAVKAISADTIPDDAGLADLQRKVAAYERIAEIVSNQYAEEIGVDPGPELLQTSIGDNAYGEEGGA